ncbi:hypothetical protein ACQ4PT_031475 [Festuca glaucescens]
MTSNLDFVQERVLAENLARNFGAEHLRNCGLDDGATDRTAFRARVPVVSYEALQPYIQRTVDGDRSPILSTQPITKFLTSSDTSADECKLMPTIEDNLDRRQSLYKVLMLFMNLEVAWNTNGGNSFGS